MSSSQISAIKCPSCSLNNSSNLSFCRRCSARLTSDSTSLSSSGSFLDRIREIDKSKLVLGIGLVLVAGLIVLVVAPKIIIMLVMLIFAFGSTALIFGGLFWLLFKVRRDDEAKKQAKIGAARIYQEALLELRVDPANPHLRQKALELGRTAARLSRDGKRVTVFDELALQNDLNATASSGNVYSQQPPSNQVQTNPSINERLTQLEDLRAKNLISEQEYNNKRRNLLDQI